MDKTPSRGFLIGAAIGVALIGLAVFLFPKIANWFVGGAIGGAVALGGAQKARRKANRAHRDKIAVEQRKLAEIDKLAENAVKDATARAKEDPQAAAHRLSVEERRARLDEAADKLR